MACGIFTFSMRCPRARFVFVTAVYDRGERCLSAIVFLVLIAFPASSIHPILGTAAAMDLGGAKLAGFALIDSFQYFRDSLAGFFSTLCFDKSWGSYFYFMAPSD